MEEINLSTIMLIGQDENLTKIITIDDEYFVDKSSYKLINQSCKFFGSNLKERIKMTNRLINVSIKSPIIIEERRNIIFFPLRSVREKVNIWISFNNLLKYEKQDNFTVLYFNGGKVISLDFSYYIIDNQVTRCMILDYELNKRRKSLEK